jgi:cation diffusion facilitator family transporter
MARRLRIAHRMGGGLSPVVPEGPVPGRTPAAALSVVSNSILILLKFVAGTITGSVAILTEALHSSIDLIASVVAYFSVRKAEEPADEDHRYGHEKIENVAAGIEGMLILVGSGVIVFESIRRLVKGSHVDSLGLGIAVIAVSMVANLAVSAFVSRRARLTDSAALAGDAAHLRTDALTSAGVLAGLVAVQLTDQPWLDPAVALAVAGAIVWSGVRILLGSARVLVDEALPADELDAITQTVRRRVPQAAHPPRRRPALRRPACPVSCRHDPRARPRHRSRAPGRDPRPAPRRRRPDSPRAGGQSEARHRDSCRAAPHFRLIAADSATTRTVAPYP